MFLFHSLYSRHGCGFGRTPAKRVNIMEPIKLGGRLREIREARKISQAAAADAIGVSRTAITKMEKGDRSVSTLELSKLASLYRRPVSAFFEEGDPAGEDALVKLYLVAPGLERDTDVSKQVGRCLDLCREGTFLRKILGLALKPGLPAYGLDVPRDDGEAVTQGEEIAREERHRLDIGNSPIGDMAELAGGQGIWASSIELPAGMSGLFLRHPSIDLVILANASHARGRKRFSYAHEYAHALLDRESDITVSSTKNSSDLVEKRANAFATAFLMPKDGVSEVLKSLDKEVAGRQGKVIFDAAGGEPIKVESRLRQISYKDVALVAHHFGVDYEVALYRLHNLRHVSRKECDRLLGQGKFGRQYLKMLGLLDDIGGKEKRQYWNRELRSEIAHLAIEAYWRGEISRGRLLELGKSLEISGRDLVELAEAE